MGRPDIEMAAIPLPLTTTFTPAPACLSDIHWASQSAWYVLGEYNTDCMPYSSGVALPNPTLSSFYSPALYCPSGYTVACSSEVGPETRAVCCPRLDDVPILSKKSFTCYTSPPNWGAWSSYGCALAMGTAVSDGPITIVATDAAGTRTTSTSLTNVNEGLNAYSVQIRWHASDLALASSTTQSSSLTSTATSSGAGSTASSEASSTALSTTRSTTPASTSTNKQAEQSNLPSGGLSTGVIIAVGVIVPIVVIVAFVAGFFIWRRKRQYRSGTRSLHSPPLTPIQAMSIPKYEMAARQSYPPQEMADTSLKIEKPSLRMG